MVKPARLIADLRLDVLVELGGYTSGSRLGILVHRPAPIQLSYLGFPAPTYLIVWMGGWEMKCSLTAIPNRSGMPTPTESERGLHGL